MLPVAAAAGVAGGLLLLHTGEAAFKAIVPYLILLAAAALVAQGRLRDWLVARSGGEHSEGWAIALVALASVYGGYFGAAMGVMLLAALAIIIGDSLIRLNALKQTISLTVNAHRIGTVVATIPLDHKLATRLRQTAAHAQADRHTGQHALTAQPVCEPVCGAVELTVVQ